MMKSSLLRVSICPALLLAVLLGGPPPPASAQVLPAAAGADAPTTRTVGPRVLSTQARAQIEAIEKDADARTPAQRKLTTALYLAAREKARGGRPAVEGAPALRSRVERTADGSSVRVRIRADVSAGLLARIEALGGQVLRSYPRYRAVYALLPVHRLEALAERPDVEFIGVPPEPQTNGGLRPRAAVRPPDSLAQGAAGTGPVTNAAPETVTNDPEGDQAHGANLVRSQYGATGKGIKVGVLSDSIDDGQGSFQSAQNNGYVSPVTIIPGQAGNGEAEGLAMLEIVHRLAPDATLYFATGGDIHSQSTATNEEQMAKNIQALVAAGCQIIVDDIAYPDEPPFQDGMISQAVNAASNQGVLYFSCSANFGNQDSQTSSCWEGDFKAGADSPTFLDFGGNGGNPNELNQVNGPNQQGGLTAALFWAEPLGVPPSEYDLYEVDQNGIVQAANDAKNPYQVLTGVTPGNYLLVVQKSGFDRFLHVDIASQNSQLTTTTAGRTRGHNATGAANAFCVAATPAGPNANSPGGPTGPAPGQFSAGNKIEPFSNDGPRRVFFNPDGSAITPGNLNASGGRVLAKPDFTAADGVTTSVPAIGGNSPFFGTSAAAPHAAAIAALLLSYKPGISPAQAGAALRAGAVQITNPGASNRDAGSGILLAPNVIQAVNLPPAIVSFSPANGPAGTVVTVSGVNLGTAVAAAVNGVAAGVQVSSASVVTVTVPAGATTGPITIVTAAGTAASAANFTLTASVATPVITSAPTAAGQVSIPFSYQITATNGPTNFGAAGLPDGLSVDPNSGLISGVPTTAGTFAVTLAAGNAAGGNNSAPLAVTIQPPPIPVVTLTKPATTLNAKGIAKATVSGAGFAFKGTVTGGQGGIKKINVNLPGYLAVRAVLNADGTWKARFTAVPPGVYPATVTATDNAGNKSVKLGVKLNVQ